MAPVLMAILCYSSAKYVLIVALAVLSFLFQCYSSDNTQHMALLSRVWQFMIGFLAFQLRSCKWKLGYVVDLLACALAVALFVPLMQDKQANRLVVLSIVLVIFELSGG